MKVDEAILRIKRHNEIHSNKEYPFAVYIAEALNMAVEALEKQIPKKVTHEARLYKCCTCPNCKNVVDKFEKWGESTVRITYKYCHFCGQNLYWSDHPTEKGGAEE